MYVGLVEKYNNEKYHKEESYIINVYLPFCDFLWCHS